MFQISKQNVYLYLPPNENGMVEMGGEYDEKLKRWRFPMSSESVVREYVKNMYPTLSDDDEAEDDDDSEEKSVQPMDKRLHRAQSFSRYDEDDGDESDVERSRSRSQKYKECNRCRQPLSNKQFVTKRNLIKSRIHY